MNETPDEPLMLRAGGRLRAARVGASLVVRGARAQIGLSDHSLLARHDAPVPLTAAVETAGSARCRPFALLDDAR